MKKFLGAVFVSVCFFGILHVGGSFFPEYMMWFKKATLLQQSIISFVLGAIAVYGGPTISGITAGSMMD